jgi:hypothetical protein
MKRKRGEGGWSDKSFGLRGCMNGVPPLYEHIEDVCSCHRRRRTRMVDNAPACLRWQCMWVRPPLALIPKTFGGHRTHSHLSTELRAHALNASYTSGFLSGFLMPHAKASATSGACCPRPHRSSVAAGGGLPRTQRAWADSGSQNARGKGTCAERSEWCGAEDG